MSEYNYTYKLQIIGGLALIPIEIQADGHNIDSDGMIYFIGDGNHIAWYPIGSTIISERYLNNEEVGEQGDDYAANDHGNTRIDFNNVIPTFGRNNDDFYSL